MFDAYGPQHWWPAESDFEVLVGAILTQNTAWTNVERAIHALKVAGLMHPGRLVECPQERLASTIRAAGYFNIKAQRLRNLCEFLERAGGLGVLHGWPTPRLRQGLLSVKGVGPETADDMLLYAFHRPVFVIDAYTRRICARVGLIRGDESYASLQRGIEQALGENAPVYNEFHALIVHHAKVACRSRHPACEPCCLRSRCVYGRSTDGDRVL